MRGAIPPTPNISWRGASLSTDTTSLLPFQEFDPSFPILKIYFYNIHLKSRDSSVV
jgi:hypothetical protein